MSPASSLWRATLRIGRRSARPRSSSSLDERIVLRLGPTTLATVFLRPEGAGTVVECVVTGRNSLVDKARAFLGHREKTLGPKMEKALAGLAASA